MKITFAALALFLAAPAAYAQQSCEAQSAPKFQGVIGRTAEDSTPAPYQPTRAAPGSPNVVYIVLDDTGFGDLGCYGASVSTPHIDALARGGLQFNNFQSKAVCSPTRASLLTGRNAHAVGMKELPGGDQGYPHTRGRVPATAANIAQILSRNGYISFAAGKWHLVPSDDMTPAGDRTHWPLQKGFSRFHGFLSGWTDQYSPDLVIDNHAVPTPQREGYHFSEDIVDQAIDMLEGKLEADADKPFFLYLAFGATHAPIQVPKRYIEKYKGAFDAGWDGVRERRYRRQLELGVIPCRLEAAAAQSRRPGLERAFRKAAPSLRPLHGSLRRLHRAHRRADRPRRRLPQSEGTIRKHLDRAALRQRRSPRGRSERQFRAVLWRPHDR